MTTTQPVQQTDAPMFVVVDDDPLIVRTLARALRPLGKVSFSTDFEQVHISVALNVPRVILVDIDLPQVTGLEIVRRIRSNPELDGTYVFLMTAHRSESVLQEARALNIDGLLEKPIEMEALLKTLQGMVGQPRSSA